MLSFLTSSLSFDWFLLCHLYTFSKLLYKIQQCQLPRRSNVLTKTWCALKSVDYSGIQGSETVFENILSEHSELHTRTLLNLWVFQKIKVLPNDIHPTKLCHKLQHSCLGLGNQRYCCTSSAREKHHFLSITLFPLYESPLLFMVW